MNIHSTNMLGACHAAMALTHSAATKALATGNDLWSPLRINRGEDAARVPFIYRAAVDWSRYTSAIVNPVVPDDDPYGAFADIRPSEEDLLRTQLLEQFRNDIAPRFTISNATTQQAIRIRVSLVGAKPNIPFLSTLSRLDPVGGWINLYQACRGGEGIWLGSITYWVEVQDACTGQLLLAYVGKGFPHPLDIAASVGRLAAAKIGTARVAKDFMRLIEPDAAQPAVLWP